MHAFVGRQRRARRPARPARRRPCGAARGSSQVEGPAGIGKTALIERFLAEATGAGRRPRCCGRAARRPRRCSPTASSTSWRGPPARRAQALAAVPARRRPRSRSSPGPGCSSCSVSWSGGPGACSSSTTCTGRTCRRVRALVFALRRLVADQVLVLLAVRDDAVAELPESLRRIVGGSPRARRARCRASTSTTCATWRGSWGSRRSPPGPPGGCATGRRQPAARPRGARRVPSPGCGPRGDSPLPSPRSFRLLVGDR